MENRFNKIGKVTYKITEILSEKPVEGVNKTTGEVWSYLRVKLQEATTGKTDTTNIFINQFNSLKDIVVGAPVNILASQDKTTGKINYTPFIATNKLTRAEFLAIAGADEKVIAEGQKQAKSALANALAARAAKLEQLANATAGV